MKFSAGYEGRFLREVCGLRIFLLEKAILLSLILMCLISVVDAFSGRDVGNPEQLRTAKLQAQQELMALRAGQGP
jgi:hypothetical protein